MTGQRESTTRQAQTTSPPHSRWLRAFPGEATQLGMVRRWIEDLLPPCAARDDVIAVVSELAANAVCHTESGRGGQFSVEVAWSGPTVSVVVGDGGGASEPRIIEDADGEHGRGLRMVRAMSVGVGVSGDKRGRFVRADLAWVADDGSGTPDAAPNQRTTAELEILQGQFAGVPIWFGLMTRQWWAMIEIGGGGGELISASSARELAVGLTAMRIALTDLLQRRARIR